VLEPVGDEGSNMWLGKACFKHVTTFAVLFQLSTPGEDNGFGTQASNGLWIASVTMIGKH